MCETASSRQPDPLSEESSLVLASRRHGIDARGAWWIGSDTLLDSSGGPIADPTDTSFATMNGFWSGLKHAYSKETQ